MGRAELTDRDGLADWARGAAAEGLKLGVVGIVALNVGYVLLTTVEEDLELVGSLVLAAVLARHAGARSSVIGFRMGVAPAPDR